ncbi:MAG: group 1 glycosyl transferase, partial [Azospira oryzae]
MKILFLVPYPLGEAPSQRFRFEQYFKILSNRGISCSTQSFLNSQNWQNMYRNGNLFKKISAVISGFLRRFYVLLEVPGYDFVFIHREAAPIGPPLIEWLIGKVMRKKIIYDFDDAIWASDNGKEGTLEKIIRWRRKVKNICKWSYKVSCGNEYLCHYARQFNSNVILNPTTIDTQHLHNPVLHKKEENLQKLVIGWTGSHSTLKYLNSIVPVIQSLEKKYPHL